MHRVKVIKKRKHKRKTMLEVFLERNPDAPLSDKRLPGICPINMGYTESVLCVRTNDKIDCKRCWNRPRE